MPSRQKLHSHIQIDIGDLSMQSSNTASYYIFSLIETDITLQQKIWYSIDVLPPKTAASSITVTDTTADNSPETGRPFVSEPNPIATPVSPVQIEFIDESRLRKTREDTLNIKCDLEFKFSGRFYTLNKKPLVKIYRGENFLFRANMEVQTTRKLDILETYFICDHNLVQSMYSFKRKKFTNTYSSGDKLEDVIVLRTNATLDDWITAKEFERNKSDPQPQNIFSRTRKHSSVENSHKTEALSGTNASNSHMNKSLMSKIPTNMTIINNITANLNSSSLLMASQNSNMSSSTISDEGKSTIMNAGADTEQNENDVKALSTRMVFNKAMDAVQATGHCRGFIKGVVTVEQQQQPQLIFGIYCIKWRQHGSNDENESKFIINGLRIEEPPLNIYCSIEEKMFVKMPMTFKVVLKNPTPKVLHLIATLSISNSDNFICSGHKQLDISIFAFGEKEIVYNLYPLCVGWQNLPELSLEYNTQADPSKDESQNNLLDELVQRSIPKQIFVLPPLKQQMK